MKNRKRKPRGFQVMSPSERHETAQMGGYAVSRGRKGKKHMSEIGKLGAEARRRARCRAS